MSKRKPVYDPQTILAFDPGPEQPAAVEVNQPKKACRRQADTCKQQLVQPLKYYGGKHYMCKKIVELMPEHTHYVEPFAGGLSVLLAKDPQGVSEVVNDLNGDLINFYRVLQDPELFERFYRHIEVAPFSQAGFQQSKQTGSDDPVQAAALFFIRMRQSRQGIGKDFATLSRNRTRRGMNEQVSAWLTAVEGLPQIHQRLRRVVICNQDAIALIKQQDGRQTFLYCDPPYLHGTRSSTGEYAHEMSDDGHRELLEVLAGIKGKFLLSGYSNELYESWAKQHGYACERIEIDNKASSAKNKQTKIECLWMNYDCMKNMS